jgi:molecular chaperone GrpE
MSKEEKLENEEVVNEEVLQEETQEPSEEQTPVAEEVDELQVAKDKYIRLFSEFENFRKRTAKEKLNLIQTANEKLILAILPVLDDVDRAQKSFDEAEDVEALKEGVNLVFEKLVKILEQKGLEKMNVQGEVFDAEIHEAITQIPASSDDMKGKIMDVVEKGYKLGEKVIRFAKVVIGA